MISHSQTACQIGLGAGAWEDGIATESGLHVVAERTTTIQRRWRRSLVLEARPLLDPCPTTSG